MAQTGYTPISIYYSATTTNTPTAGNLVAGELAINTADGKLFYKDSAGVVQVIGTKGGVGSSTTTQVLYNSSGLVVGSANMTFSGTALTLANDASISGLTVGKGSGTTTQSTAIGNAALSSANTVGYNTALGYFALQLNTSGANNTAVGNQALNVNTSGIQNTGIGSFALYSNTTGSNNNALGQGAMYYNTTGGNNTAIGQSALQSNTTATNNTAVGYQALYASATSTGNTAFGYRALYSHNGAGGSYLNCAIGNSAGAAITNGYVNCILGADSTANSLTSGAYNTYIGTCDASAGGVTLELVVAATNPKVTGKGTSTAFITANGGSTYNGANSTLWAITSDQRLKKNIVDNNNGLSKILPIQVRNFEYRLPEEITEISPDQAIKKDGIQLGAIAQEIQAVLPECVKQESTGVYTVDADPLIWYLVNAVKELKAEIDQLKAK